MISPEERLFNVIQEGKEATSIRGRFKSRIMGLSGQRIKQFFGRAKSLKAPFAVPVKLHEINLKAVNAGLVVVLTIFTGMVVHYAVNKKPNIARITSAISKIQIQALKNKRVIETFKPVDFYLEAVEKRNVFEPSASSFVKASAPEKQAIDELKEMVVDFSVKGISWGIVPKVMIKDEKEDKVYFLKQGQTIGATGIEVKTIYKDKVVITYGEGEMEL